MWLSGIVAFLLFLLLFAYFVITSPVGQTFIVQQISSYALKNYDVRMSVDGVNISFFDHLIIDGLYVEDHRRDTLAQVEKIDAGLWKLLFNDDQNTLNIRGVKLFQPKFYMRNYEGDSTSNVKLLMAKFSQSEPDTTKGKPFNINLSEFQLRNGKFIYEDQNVEPISYGVDWKHLNLDSIYMHLRTVTIHGDSIEADFMHFEFKEQSGFQINEFAGHGTYTSKRSEMKNLRLITPQSRIIGDLRFNYDSPADYADFNQQVRINSSIIGSKLNFEDITYFAPNLEGWNDEFEITGDIKGTVSSLRAQNLELSFGEYGYLGGNANIMGLPDVENTFFQLNVNDLHAKKSDITSLTVPPYNKGEKIPLPQALDKLGTMRFKGSFTGFIKDFVANGELRSALGYLDTDVKLSQTPAGVMEYSGRLKARNFNFGKLIDNEETMGRVSLTAQVKGREFDLDLIDADMDGTVHKLELFNYTYNDINVGGNFKNKKFSGNFDIKDSNLVMDFEGDILLGDSFDLSFNSNIEKIFPARLKLVNRDTSLYGHGRIESNFRGTSLDDVLGRVSLDSVLIKEKSREAEVGKIDVVARATNQEKIINLQNQYIQTTLSGKFNFDKLPKAFAYMFNKIAPAAFADEVQVPEDNERFELDLHLSNTGKITRIFMPDFLGPDTLSLKADFNVREQAVNLTMRLDDWYYRDVHFHPMDFVYTQNQTQVEWDFNTPMVKISDSSHIRNIGISGRAAADTMGIYLIWDNKLEKRNFAGNIFLTAKLFDKSKFEFDFYHSELLIADTLWTLNSESRIAKDRDTITVDEFKFFNGNQELVINGKISPDPEDEIAMNANDFDLTNFNFFLAEFNIMLEGIMDGGVSARDLYKSTVVNSDLHIDQFKFNEVTLGNAKLDTRYYTRDKQLVVDVAFKDKERRYIAVKGNVFPAKKDSVFDLKVLVDSLPVKVAEPFLENYIDNFEGGLSANLTLRGNVDEPKLEGDVQMRDFETRVVYLNTKYKIPRGDFFVMHDLIGGDLVNIIDSKGRKAVSNISVTHKKFNDFAYDIFIRTPEGFEVLNTTAKDNDLFYGTANIDETSSVTIETRNGGVNQLTVDAGTGKNTALKLPLGDETEVLESDYVKFINPNEKEENEETNRRIVETEDGFLMDFKLRVSPDASVQLIFDETVGDIIEAEGNGDIALKIDENFDFSIFGTYEITRGSYLFTLQDVINKKFKVQPGSKISWNGDPLKGIADITAIYTVRTNLHDLNLPVTQDTNELKRRIPIDLLLHMKGNYMEPDISFSLKLPERHRDIENLLANMEEGDKNKQVFSLLILNKFVAYGGAGSAPAGGGAIGNNSFEMISNQLSNLLSNISNEFDIGVNYRPGDEISAEEMQVALSTQLLDDRLTFEANVGVQGDNPAAADRGSQVMGDMNLEYKITEDGRIRGRVFNRSNMFNPAYENQAPYTQGAGIMYTESFKNFAHLRCLIRQRLTSEENGKVDCNKVYRRAQFGRESEGPKPEDESP